MNRLMILMCSFWISITASLAYVRFHKIAATAEKGLVSVTMSVENTPNNESGILNSDITFLVKVIREQDRIKIYRESMSTTGANGSSNEILSTSLDVCKALDGVRSFLLVKVAFENFEKSREGNATHMCPFSENYNVKMKDWEFSDTFLPPMPTGIHFRLTNDVYGMLEGRKKWQKLFSYTLWGSYKK